MVKTMNEDDFVPGPCEQVTHNYEPHSILYGSEGWTDELDDTAIDFLVNVGAITLNRTIHGVGFETRIYVSVEGRGPREANS